MNEQQKTLEEVQAILATLRKSPSFHNKFPEELWSSIIEPTFLDLKLKNFELD